MVEVRVIQPPNGLALLSGNFGTNDIDSVALS